MNPPMAEQPPTTLPSSAASTLPIDVWSIVFQFVAAPLTQFIGSPTTATSLDCNDRIYARQDLLHTAHVNKAAYIAARPFLYGNLYLFLRTDPTTFDLPTLEHLGVEESTSHSTLTGTARLNYYAYRARHHAGRAIFARVCCAKCARQHVARELIEKVSEVPEVFPFVVRGGKLYLPAFLEHESEATRTPEAIGRSVASLLGGSEDGGASQVEIVNGLVLVPYPFHLVSGIHIHSGDVSFSSWLATTKKKHNDRLPFIVAESSASVGKDHHDWAVKLPFILSLPAQRLTSLTLVDHDEDDQTAFTTLCNDLFQAYPHIRTLDILSNLGYRYNFPVEFPNRVQQVSLYPHSHGWEEDYNRLPEALSRIPLRHLEIYGGHSFILKHWEQVFNHPTLSSLVTDFTYNSADQDPQRLASLSAPALESWTTNSYIAHIVFMFLDMLVSSPAQPIFVVLQDLTLVHANWDYWSTVSLPKGHTQVPSIPFARLPTLCKFSVLPRHSEQHVWINMKAAVLVDLLSLPRIHHISLPSVLPYFPQPLTPTPIRCDSLRTLDINVNLFVDMLPSVELPNVTSLMLHTDYFTDPEHQLSCDMWVRIHDRWGLQLAHFGYRRLSFKLESSPPCAFPPDLDFPTLRSIDMLTCVGTLDLAHIATVAPNLDTAKIDADHVSNLPALLTHPSLTRLRLAGPRCPTMLESLLAHPPPPALRVSLIPRAVRGLHGEFCTGIGRVCTRTSVTLTYDRDWNWHVWRMLAGSWHLGRLPYWISKGDADADADDAEHDQVQKENAWRANVVVPSDLGPREARNVGRLVGEVLGEWEGVKVKVGVREGMGGRVESRSVARLVEAVMDKMESASVEWVGEVQAGEESEADGVCGDE